jgi:outer membrane protein assembly factor BamD
MNHLKFFISFITLFLFNPLWSGSLSGRPINGNAASINKEYLFPGTGFFKKNRDPLNDVESKAIFLEAEDAELAKDTSKALSLYEKFAARRSDSRLVRKTVEIQIGPESLYRAANLREKNGDWQKAFQHLRLIAKAYTEYDFEQVAESLMKIAERLAKDKLPRKWGVLPRFRSGSQDRLRLNQIIDLARGPRFAPRALMVLAEIAQKEDQEEEALDALERLTNLYPDNFLCEEAYFILAEIFENRVAGPSYDQGATLKALNFYEDYLILFAQSPPQSKHELLDDYKIRVTDAKKRTLLAEEGRKEMRETLAASKLEVGQYVEKYGKYYLTHWRELGNRPALQFYNEAITTAPESKAAREAERRVAELRHGE